MAFTPATLQCILQRTGPLGISLWVYDTIDATAAVDAVGYFTNVGAGAADPKGMEVGDLMIVRIWTTAVPTGSTAAKNEAPPADAGLHVVRAVSAAGAATISTETALSVAETS